MQQAAGHVAKPVEAVLHDEVDHRLIVVGKSPAKLVVDQLEKDRLRGGYVENFKVRIEPGLNGMCPAGASHREEWIVEIRVEVAERADQ